MLMFPAKIRNFEIRVKKWFEDAWDLTSNPHQAFVFQ